jgi:glutathione S-transferase
MSYTLYYYAGACSMVPHIVLEELSLPYVAKAAPRANDEGRADYLKNINPLGAVPALVLADGKVITQNIAIVDYLAGQVPASSILGAVGSYQRANAMRWLNFANSDVHPAFKPIFGPARYVADEATHAELRAKAQATVLNLFAVTERGYANQDWIAGEFSAADAYLYVVFRWATSMKFDLSAFPFYRAMVDRIQARASVKKVLEIQGVPAI